MITPSSLKENSNDYRAAMQHEFIAAQQRKSFIYNIFLV